MPFPESPCESCPRVAKGLPGTCLAVQYRNPRYCHHAAAGHAGYLALLCGEPPPAVIATDRAAIEARRARKIRLPLGQRIPAKKEGG